MTVTAAAVRSAEALLETLHEHGLTAAVLAPALAPALGTAAYQRVSARPRTAIGALWAPGGPR
jgi:hypothetical protein